MLDDLSLHILDIAENGVNAGAGRVTVEIDHDGDLLRLIVSDNGRGMDEETVKSVVNPFYHKDRAESGAWPSLPEELSELCEVIFRSFGAGEGTEVSSLYDVC